VFNKRRIEILAVTGITFLYLLLKGYYLENTIGDQGVYYYASWLWAHGLVPYRDFFISHPPLHLLPSTILIAIFGVNLTILNALPSLLGAGSGIILYLISRRALGMAGALATLLFFLFSYAHLSFSSHFTGINVTLFFLLLGLYFVLTKKPKIAGIVFGLSALSGVYAIIGIASLCIALLMEGQRKSVLRIVTFFILTFALINLLFVAISGWDFIDQVYMYHFAKSGGEKFFADKLSVFSIVIKKNIPLIVLMLCSIPLFFWEYRKWQKGSLDSDKSALRVMRLSLITISSYILFFLLLQKIFSHYFLLLIPFVALCVGYIVSRISVGRVSNLTIVSWLSISFLATISVGQSLVLYAENRESKSFTEVKEISAFVNSQLKEGERIYGDFGIVPTISLLSDRHIAGHEVDSSIMRFASGKYDLDSVIESLEEDNLQMVVSREHRGIVIYPPFKKYLKQNYNVSKTFDGVVVWRRR
jgi:hypothetical protein